MTHSSPSSTAVVLSEARSEPESGSEKPWHHAISPFMIAGRKCFFCSSVPCWRMVGPTSVSPKKSARSGALAAVLLGPRGADPAAAVELGRPGLVERLLLVGGLLEPLVEPAAGEVLLQ